MGTEPIQADSLSIDALEIAGVTLSDVPAVAMDLDTIFQRLGAPDGILPAAAFDGYLMTLDYPKGLVMVRPGELPATDGRAILEYDDEHIVPHIFATLGDQEVEFALDTGAPSTFTLPDHYAESLPLTSEPVVTGAGHTVDASFEVRSATLDATVKIGDIQIEKPMVSFVPNAPYGNIGMEFLGDYAVTIDSKNHRIQFARGESTRPSVGAQRKMVRGSGNQRGYGIGFAGISGDSLPVQNVIPGGVAEAAGLQGGDVIVAINGEPLEGMTQEARIGALRGPALVLLVQRDGEELELKMEI